MINVNVMRVMEPMDETRKGDPELRPLGWLAFPQVPNGWLHLAGEPYWISGTRWMAHRLTAAEAGPGILGNGADVPEAWLELWVMAPDVYAAEANRQARAQALAASGRGVGPGIFLPPGKGRN